MLLSGCVIMYIAMLLCVYLLQSIMCDFCIHVHAFVRVYHYISDVPANHLCITFWLCFRDEWKGYLPPYVPRFYDGWQPAPTLVDEPAPRSNIETAVVAHHDQIRNRAQEQDVRDYVRKLTGVCDYVTGVCVYVLSLIHI